MIKVGLFGYGHLGKIHHNCMAETPFELAGIYDPKLINDESNDIGSLIVKDVNELMENCDACIIASTTSTHHDLVVKAIRHKKHFFVEKPMTSTLDQAIEIVDMLSSNPNIISQVGFVERYNPAFKYIEQEINNPRFIEVHRLASFSERGSDVSVVFDLMIHDLDMALSMIDAEVIDIKANGVRLVSDTMDICSARIEFDNKSIVNVTASRMSLKQMRKFRIFQEKTYLSLDLVSKKAEMVAMSDQATKDYMEMSFGDRKKYMSYKSSGTLSGNAIQDELNDFHSSIVSGNQSKVNCHSALRTTRIADQIERIAIESSIL